MDVSLMIMNMRPGFWKDAGYGQLRDFAWVASVWNF